MAERFFKKEVQKLYLGAGQEFRGQGILTVMPAADDTGKKLETALAELKLPPGGSL